MIDRLPAERAGTEGPLSVLASGLNDFLGRAPLIEHRECQVSKEFAWLLAPALHSVERLVSQRATAAFSPASIEVMLKVPAARYWHDVDFSDRKEELAERLARWPELNDALFWSSVEAARRLREEKGEKLTDDWPIQYLGHFWSFRAGDLERVIGFVTERPEEDDRLIAVSLAYRICRSNDLPASSLDALWSAVGSEASLLIRLEELLDASKSQEVEAFQRRERKRQRKQDLKRKKQAEDRTRWIRELQSNPDRIRSPNGAAPGEITYDHLWLLSEIEKDGRRTDRHGGAAWEALIRDFGEDVARAYRDAAIAHWRIYRPTLRSEGVHSNGTPYAVVFGLVGLEIEAREAEDFFDSLSEVEFKHMLRYATWELNGFPTWLEAAYRARGGLVLDAFVPEIRWEFENSSPENAPHHILHDIVYHAPWLHCSLVEHLLSEMESSGAIHADTLRYSLHILRSGSASGDRMADFARARIERDIDTGNAASLFALWVDTDAEAGVPALEAWLESKGDAEASKSAQLFVTALMGGRHGAGRGPAIGSYRSATFLKRLYILMHRYIRSSEDIERAGTGVYSPVLRDDAQDGRNAIFSLLAEITGEDAYLALKELARDHPNERSRDWMAKLAYRRAEADGDLQAWTASDMARF
ncbi:hypothetical protein [Tabrizicola sp.]|uniref:hypothetical protein n=1 Tax=Tabrizicola sp. TaxID=2005166 RepID=UPI003F34DF85